MLFDEILIKGAHCTAQPSDPSLRIGGQSVGIREVAVSSATNILERFYSNNDVIITAIPTKNFKPATSLILSSFR